MKGNSKGGGMTIIKIIGVLIVSCMLIGFHKALAIISHDLRSGNFHEQDPKTFKYKYIQFVIFIVILWLLGAFLVVSLAKQWLFH